ncbi:GtrA family protein [Spirosoma utsteinense]|uniref:Flippase GtrA n=1 Tax=Spirosoma utsteinense TaxID=2585773 RepID=A0ABR6W122_9BACT|nr:GtrA family protein [Spirosoma utsteinense]MBC3785080.1 putative flippase GtrA [Spirosoma utsteinense]MBC3790311.1 putative flippase GtrA [Spirosoma utsteinense]
MNVSTIQQSKQKESKDFFTFFLTAVLGASINFVTRIFYRNYFDFDTSVLCGYLTATVLTFIPTKRYAFSAGDTGNTGREAIKFLGIALVALFVQVYVAKYTLEWIATPLFPSPELKLWRETGSHLTGMGMSFMANYFGHKLLTFRSTGMYDKLRARSSKQEEEQF